MPGRFWGPTPKSFFPQLAPVAMSPLRLETATLRSFLSLSVRQFLVVTWYLQVWQLLRRRSLLMRNSSPIRHSSSQLSSICSGTVTFTKALSVRYVIADRGSFAHMFDSEAALKDGASDLGFDLTAGVLPHKREFARVVTSWKTAKIMAETKLQTDAVAKAHGLPVALLPCDWFSILTEFKKNTETRILTIDCRHV